MKERKLLLEKESKSMLVLLQCNNAKVILMITVVICHCFAFWGGWFTNNPVYNSKSAKFIAEWLGSFHVYAFTLISGYLFYYLQMEVNHYPNFTIFIRKKVHRLITPSLAIGLLWVVPITNLFIPLTIQEIVKKYILLYHPSQLWFLGMLFNCFVLGWSLRNFAQRHSLLLILLCIAMYCVGMVGIHYQLDYLMIFTGCMFFPFFEMGYKIRQINSDLLFQFSPLSLLIIDLLLFTCLFSISENLSGIPKSVYFIFRFLINMFGAFSVFSILVQLSNRYEWNNMKLFKYLSQRTMIIYLFHQQIVYFFITFFNGTLPPIIHGIINFIGTIIITLIISNGILRIKSLRFLTGN